MEWRLAGWSVCLPLLIFPCTTKSRSSLLAPAHAGGPGKRAVKRLCVCVLLTYWTSSFLDPETGSWRKGSCTHYVNTSPEPDINSAYNDNWRHRTWRYLLAASWIWCEACSTSSDENWSSNIRTASEVPNGLSGSMTLLMKTLMMFSGFSWSGDGGPPINLSPSSRSKEMAKQGISTYCRICSQHNSRIKQKALTWGHTRHF